MCFFSASIPAFVCSWVKCIKGSSTDSLSMHSFYFSASLQLRSQLSICWNIHFNASPCSSLKCSESCLHNLPLTLWKDFTVHSESFHPRCHPFIRKSALLAIANEELLEIFSVTDNQRRLFRSFLRNLSGNQMNMNSRQSGVVTINNNWMSRLA